MTRITRLTSLIATVFSVNFTVMALLLTINTRKFCISITVIILLLTFLFEHFQVDLPHVIYRMCGWIGSRVVSVLDSGAEGLGFKSQLRRCRVTVLGKLFTPIVPLFTKQRNW